MFSNFWQKQSTRVTLKGNTLQHLVMALEILIRLTSCLYHQCIKQQVTNNNTKNILHHLFIALFSPNSSVFSESAESFNEHDATTSFNQIANPSMEFPLTPNQTIWVNICPFFIILCEIQFLHQLFYFLDISKCSLASVQEQCVGSSENISMLHAARFLPPST